MFAKSFLSAVNRSSVVCMRTMATEGKIQGEEITIKEQYLFLEYTTLH